MSGSATAEDVESLLEKKESKPQDVPKNGLAARILDLLCIILNIASTVVLVFLNKWYSSICPLHRKLGQGVQY